MSETPHILIVDDELTARDTLEMLLFKDGYNLTFAASGPEALAQLETTLPDVILLDVMMSDMDGFEVCRRLKTAVHTRHIPIILVTALDDKAGLVSGFEAGADDFLHKPVNGLELRARVRSMLRIKQQYDALQATLRLREDLAAMIIHDMRGPLTTILGLTQLLEDSLDDPAALTDIQSIQEEAVRLNAFSDDMLMLAKMNVGKLILNRTPTDVGQVIAKVERSHAVVAQSKQITLRMNLPEQIPSPVNLDKNLFQRVLDNLISNALKFTPAGSMVEVKLEYLQPSCSKSEKDQRQLSLKVIDEGPGIPVNFRDRIFDQFEIIAMKRASLPQIGLGLAFCKMVVEAHGGCISVEDNEPTGAIFWLEI